jgi:hypothetical protein
MSHKREILGSGLTSIEATTFSAPFDGKDAELLKQQLGSVKHEALPQYLERIESAARSVLTELGLPVEYGAYVQEDGGPWRFAGTGSAASAAVLLASQQRRRAVACIGPWRVIRNLGHPHDSPQGYSARVIELVAQARAARGRDDFDGFGRLMLQLGEMTSQARFKAIFEKDTMRGRDVIAGSGMGGKQRRTPAKVENAIVESFARLKAEKWPKVAAYVKLATEFGKSERTIRRIIERNEKPQ